MKIQRKSKQRDAILYELKSRCDHPTACELYYSVKKKIPSLSLGTLYRNLGQLEEAGLIIKISDDKNDRFDGNPFPHAHFKCSKCGKVYDIKNDLTVNLNKIKTSNEIISQLNDYSIFFNGICRECEEIVNNK